MYSILVNVHQQQSLILPQPCLKVGTMFMQSYESLKFKHIPRPCCVIVSPDHKTFLLKAFVLSIELKSVRFRVYFVVSYLLVYGDVKLPSMWKGTLVF